MAGKREGVVVLGTEEEGYPACDKPALTELADARKKRIETNFSDCAEVKEQ